MIRFLDIIFSLIGLIIFSPLFLILYLLIFLENGNPLFFQRRVGKNLKVFVLVKFRTMKIDTPSKGTHLIKKSSITFIGSILRTTKIDEFPQLWNILKGDLSLVGPRPCLENQKKLISERKKKKIFKIRPGLTGLAQIKGITMSTPTLLAKTDYEMMKKMNFWKYLYYLILTTTLIFK